MHRSASRWKPNATFDPAPGGKQAEAGLVPAFAFAGIAPGRVLLELRHLLRFDDLQHQLAGGCTA